MGTERTSYTRRSVAQLALLCCASITACTGLGTAIVGGSIGGDAVVTDADAVATDADAVVTDADAVATDADAVVMDADAVATDADAVVMDADAVVMDEDAVVMDVDAVVTDADAVVTDADAVVIDRDAVADVGPDVLCAAGTRACAGTCVSTDTDPLQCGECGHVCVAPDHAFVVCVGGVCIGGMCHSGYGNCDGQSSTGCETPLDTLLDCGACGNRCSIANAVAVCAAGACAIGACHLGFADCDGAGSNGCEVDLSSDARQCGVCGHACLPGRTCVGGLCVLPCTLGLSPCGAVTADLCGDPNHCGGCGHACAPGAMCVNGMCGLSLDAGVI